MKTGYVKQLTFPCWANWSQIPCFLISCIMSSIHYEPLVNKTFPSTVNCGHIYCISIYISMPQANQWSSPFKYFRSEWIGPGLTNILSKMFLWFVDGHCAGGRDIRLGLYLYLNKLIFNYSWWTKIIFPGLFCFPLTDAERSLTTTSLHVVEPASDLVIYLVLLWHSLDRCVQNLAFTYCLKI